MFRPSTSALAAVPRRLFSTTPTRRNAFADLAKITSTPSAAPPAAFVKADTAKQSNIRGYAPRMLPPEVDPTLELFTNLLMHNGKKTAAQKQVANVLALVQAATNAPPVPQVKKAIELAAPSLRLLSMRKGPKTIMTPRALNKRQRTRIGIQNLIKTAERSRGGQAKFCDRIAREILMTLEGTSEVFKRVEEVHKLATLNRYVEDSLFVCILANFSSVPTSTLTKSLISSLCIDTIPEQSTVAESSPEPAANLLFGMLLAEFGLTNGRSLRRRTDGSRMAVTEPTMLFGQPTSLTIL